MKSIKFLGLFTFILSAMLAFNTNLAAQSNGEILIVADQKTSCRGIVAQDCLQVKRLDEEKFQIFRQSIRGFNFVPGYFYVLDVAAYPLPSPTGQAYRLNKVLARVKSPGNPGTPGQPGFFDTNWKLTKIDGNAVDLEKPFIKFDEAKNSIGGNGGCNVFGGSMEKNGSQLKFSKIFSTKMFCQGAQTVENKFLGSLDRVTNYEIKGGKLFLKANNKILLEFEPKK